jgi:hypothetical protein
MTAPRIDVLFKTLLVGPFVGPLRFLCSDAKGTEGEDGKWRCNREWMKLFPSNYV